MSNYELCISGKYCVLVRSRVFFPLVWHIELKWSMKNLCSCQTRYQYAVKIVCELWILFESRRESGIGTENCRVPWTECCMFIMYLGKYHKIETSYSSKTIQLHVIWHFSSILIELNINKFYFDQSYLDFFITKEIQSCKIFPIPCHSKWFTTNSLTSNFWLSSFFIFNNKQFLVVILQLQ